MHGSDNGFQAPDDIDEAHTNPTLKAAASALGQMRERPTSSGSSTGAPPPKFSCLDLSGDVGSLRGLDRRQADILKREAVLKQEREDFELAKSQQQAQLKRDKEELARSQDLLKKRQEEYDALHYWARQGQEYQKIKQSLSDDLKNRRQAITDAIERAKNRVKDAIVIFYNETGRIAEREMELRQESELSQQHIAAIKGRIEELWHEMSRAEQALNTIWGEMSTLHGEHDATLSRLHDEMNSIGAEIARLERELADLFAHYRV